MSNFYFMIMRITATLLMQGLSCAEVQHMVYADGLPVEMPSVFDEFSAIVDRDYGDVPNDAANNAMLL